MLQVAQLNVPVAGMSVKRSVTSENSPKRDEARQAASAACRAPPAGFRVTRAATPRRRPGGRRRCRLAFYLIQASTLSRLASTHFFAAASADILSTAMYLATVFWSSFVQLNFFTRS